MARRLVAFGAMLVAGIAITTLTAQVQVPSDTLALAGGRVIPSPDGAPVDDAVVVVTGGKIVDVGPRARAKIPPGARTIDIKGLTVVAGFQNNHVHFTEEKWANAKGKPAEELTAALQSFANQYGFTTVVDTASLLSNTVELRWRVATGEVKGPRILTSGLALYPANGIPYYIKDVVPPEALKLLPLPATAAEAADIVRRNVEGGANLVKLFAASPVSRNQVVSMAPDVASGAAIEAHRRNLLVFAHPANVAGLDVALGARVDVLTHAVEDTSGLTPIYLRRMKSQNVAMIPTLKLLAGDGRPELLKEVQDYSRLGGQILFGTDAGYLADYDPLREYQLMEASGLTWRQILASLTTNPANRFKESDVRGRVARGMAADLVVLGSDPAQGVVAFTDVRYAIRDGTMIFEKRVGG